MTLLRKDRAAALPITFLKKDGNFTFTHYVTEKYRATLGDGSRNKWRLKRFYEQHDYGAPSGKKL